MLLDQVKALAEKRSCTLGQIALAWLFGQGDDIVPIPGTKRIKYLEENVGACDVVLAPDELKSLSAMLQPEGIAGSRAWTAPT